MRVEEGELSRGGLYVVVVVVVDMIMIIKKKIGKIHPNTQNVGDLV